MAEPGALEGIENVERWMIDNTYPWAENPYELAESEASFANWGDEAP